MPILIMTFFIIALALLMAVIARALICLDIIGNDEDAYEIRDKAGKYAAGYDGYKGDLTTDLSMPIVGQTAHPRLSVIYFPVESSFHTDTLFLKLLFTLSISLYGTSSPLSDEITSCGIP